MNVPKLRFKEFNDRWVENNLEDISKIYDGTHQTPDYKSHGVKFVSVENINNINETDKFISKEAFEKEFKIKPKINDILMTRITAGIIGATTIVTNNDPLGYYVSLALIRKNDNVDVNFLNQYINSYLFKKELNKRIIHVAFPKKINLGDIGKCKVSITNKNEQEKIGKFLSLLDKKIELQTKKIEDLKLFKKGLINKIFSSSELTEVQIKDLGTIITGTTPSKDNKNYWENGSIAWITPTDINYERDISNSITLLTKEGLEKGRLVPKNSILVTCIASIGKNAVIKVNGSCNQQINAIIPNENYNSNYIYYLMEYISPYLQTIAGTSATAIVNKETFERVKVKVHILEEQKKIDSLLSYIEKKIILEDKLLNNLKQLKKGLMQNMFV